METDKLIDIWFEFRNEELNKLNEGEVDNPSWDNRIEVIKKYIKLECLNECLEELENTCTDMMLYTDKWNERFYKSGFRDAIELILDKKIGKE